MPALAGFFLADFYGKNGLVICIMIARLFKWMLPLSIFGVFFVVSTLNTLNGSPAQYAHLGEVVFFSATVWLTLLAAVRSIWLAQLICLPVALMLPVEIWLRNEMGTPFSVQSMALVWETSWGEAVNFLSTYGATLGVFWLGWLLFYMVSLVYAYRCRLFWSHRSAAWCLLILPSVFFVFYAGIGYPSWIGDENSANASLDGALLNGWSQQWTDVFPVNIVVAVQHYAAEQKNMEKIQASLSKKSLHGKLLKTDDAPDIIVLIIGESSTATRWGVLGYHEKTTPYLDGLDNRVVFSDVVGLSLATRTAVPGVLSRNPMMRPDGVVNMNAEPSLLKAFAEAGYQTHWFSNQAPFGVSDGSIAVYAREAANVRFMNPSSYTSKGSLDEVLLEPLKALLETPGRHLVVLHTLGSHFDYSMRYPDSFNHFKPSGKDNNGLILDKEEYKLNLSNDYNNSVLYTDYIISQVVDKVKRKNKKSVIAYFSDHGVDLPKKECSYHESARMGEAAYRVPVLFWFSDQMMKSSSSLLEKLKGNKDKPYTTKAMFSTLLDIGQVDISGERVKENFLSYSDAEILPRMVATGSKLVDFDRARKNNSCIISSY